MDTLPSNPNLSDEGTSDVTVDRNLLFRLHNDSSQTFFHSEKKVLVASFYSEKLKGASHEGLSLRFPALEKTLEEEDSDLESGGVAGHITSWKNNNKKPSKFISLTSNVLYVFWEWKRRMSTSLRQSKRSRDDFIIIVLKSSELHASGRAKSGTEWLLKEENRDAYRFAEHHEEVIVAKYIQSGAILGFMPISELEDSIPPWCRKLLEQEKKIPGPEKKLSFRDSLPPEVDKVNCVRARESLCFALALLAPMLVPGEQQRANIGSVVGCSTIEHSRAEDPLRP
jgi:hypothetical protein